MQNRTLKGIGHISMARPIAVSWMIRMQGFGTLRQFLYPFWESFAFKLGWRFADHFPSFEPEIRNITEVGCFACYYLGFVWQIKYGALARPPYVLCGLENRKVK